MAIKYLEFGLEQDFDFGNITPTSVRMEKLIPENHEFLMQFIDFDISRAEKPLAEYLTCLDTGKDPKKQLLLAAMAELQQMHPYFLFCRENAAWLLNRIFAGQIQRRFPDMDISAQKSLFLNICVSDYSIYTDPDHIFDYAIKAGKKYVLERLYDLQTEIRTWVFLTLDNTNPALAALSSKKRNALYSHISNKENEHALLHTEVEYSMRQSERIRKESAKWIFGEEDFYENVYKGLDTLLKKPDSALSSGIQAIIDAAADTEEDCDIITFKIEDFSNLLELEVFQMTQSEIRMKRCKNCGKYFIIEKSNQEYCSRLSPGSTKLCTEIGRIRVYGKKITGDTSAAGLYRKAYKTHYARFTRGQMSESDLERWKIEAQEKRDLAKDGKMDLFEYEEWLKL